jgi:UDP:flavonoid glycosyltransferase YjiC (YdhE family)
MSAGAPVITLAGTWIARVVQRFGAGIVLDDTHPESILEAVQSIIAAYTDYRDRALHTGHVMGSEHDAGFLFKALTGN